MSIAGLLPLALLTACLAHEAAGAEVFDYIRTSATPANYEGHCPVSIKLEGVIKFDVSFNVQEKYFYRWENDHEPLTEFVPTFSKGRTNHVEGSIELSGPPGASITMPIRLHTVWDPEFRKVNPYFGVVANDHYSSPVPITVTCR
jgi:hypothetical protein